MDWLGGLGGLWRTEELLNEKGHVQKCAIAVEENDGFSWSEKEHGGVLHAVRAAEAILNVMLLRVLRVLIR